MGLPEDYEEALKIAADENAEADSLRRALKVLEPMLATVKDAIRLANQRLEELQRRGAY